ncbi:MAG TPA: GNAT family N-acetyltransferase [Kofleriaceae bacterium]|nr:GNAT family N-acetyltransferase [Kofleriaceae bacterium]
MATLPPVIPTVTTARLVLRPFAAVDAPAVVELAGDWEVSRFLLHVPHPYPPELATSWIATHAEAWLAGAGPTWAIMRAADRELLGTVSLRWTARHARAELGYWLGRAHWGQGYALEAARAATRWAFEQLGLTRVYAQHLAGNDRSARVLLAVGMRFEGIRRQHLRRGGILHDVHLYGRLRDDPAPP